MILVTLTRAQARRLAETTDDAQILDQICSQFLFEPKAPGTLEADPKTIVFRDEGDGLHVAAMSFMHEAAADRAWARFFADQWMPRRSRHRDRRTP